MKLLTQTQLAKITGKDPGWLSRIGQELETHGHAAKLGNRWVYYDSAIDYIKTRKDGRGRPRKEQSK